MHTIGCRIAALAGAVWLFSGCSSGGTPPVDGGEESCAAPSDAGTTHQDNITADETWTAAGSPHILTFGFDVRDATLTIEPCAIVRVKKGYTLGIGQTGGAGFPAAKLIARGTPTRPILFENADPDTYWGSLSVFGTGTADLENVTLKNAGDPATAQGFGGALVVHGDDNRAIPIRNVRAKGVRIEGSAGLGINVQNSGGFTTDSDVVVTNCGRMPTVNPAIDTSHPIYVTAPSIQALPSGTFTGNAIDEIFVGSSSLDGDERFRNLGLPYRLRDSYSQSPLKTLAQGGLNTLTIEPGVTIKLLGVPSNVWAFNLGNANGPGPDNIWPVKLIAAGTIDQPITFTSASPTPAAGDWGGIDWGGAPGAGNVMTFVKVLYAGGGSGTLNFSCGPVNNEAALLIRHWKPTEDFIQNSTFADSAAAGIVSGWVSDDPGPNFKNGNSFSNIGNGCAVARWSNFTPPACPGMRPVCF